MRDADEEEEARGLQAEAVVWFHRHGDRTPYYEMPRDVDNNARWGMRAGQLTPRGMGQLESLGALLRERYLLGRPFRVAGSNYSGAEFYARSTDFDRTLQSAQSLLHGLFPPGTGPPGGLSGRAQPVPVHTLPKALDTLLLSYQADNCERLAQLQRAVRASPEWEQLDRDHADVWAEVSRISGYDPATIHLGNLSVVSDPLVCERAHGFPWLPGFQEDPELFNVTKTLADWTLRRKYANSPEMRRITGGGMLTEVLRRFSDADGPRISHFSAHDTTLICLLGALGAFDDANPPYASSVVFELLRGADAERFVRVFFNRGLDAPFEAPLELCESGALCPLQEFQATFADMVGGDYAKLCRAGRPTLSREDSAGMLGGVVVAATVLLMLLLCACGRSAKQGKAYSTVDNDREPVAPAAGVRRRNVDHELAAI